MTRELAQRLFFEFKTSEAKIEMKNDYKQLTIVKLDTAYKTKQESFGQVPSRCVGEQEFFYCTENGEHEKLCIVVKILYTSKIKHSNL